MLNNKEEPLLSFIAAQFDKHLANQHAAYSEIEWELEDSRNSFIRTTEFISDVQIHSALFVNAIMAYGRVFASADGRNGIKLEGTARWVGSEHNSIKRHNELMDFRHKLIAHSGHSPYRLCQTSIVTDVVADKQQAPMLRNSLPREISFGIVAFKIGIAGFGNEDIDETSRYIEKIILKVKEKKKELESKLTDIAVRALLVPENTEIEVQHDNK
ncbi:MAG: hypothetical protein A2X86_00490 [Bdellovibrionales bacterium GWA2_49_15]|nr:MAG: hypothetical protein A2X86_00490 [Bdellovibrionales bacterium GWA2_49_15]HAZ13256.1 hypothetical protein [Bdellovibrionales bacterium]